MLQNPGKCSSRRTSMEIAWQDKWNSPSTLLHIIKASAGVQDPILDRAHPERCKSIKESPEQ